MHTLLASVLLSLLNSVGGVAPPAAVHIAPHALTTLPCPYAKQLQVPSIATPSLAQPRVAPAAGPTPCDLAGQARADELKGHFDEAAQTYLAAAAAGYPSGRADAARDLLLAGHTHEAIAQAQQAVHDSPNGAYSQFMEGFVLQRLGFTAEATAAYRKAPNETAAHNNLGVLYQERGYLGRARTEYTEASNLRISAQATANLGTLDLLQGDTKSAALHFADAAFFRTPETLLSLARYYDMTGRAKEALDASRRATEASVSGEGLSALTFTSPEMKIETEALTAEAAGHRAAAVTAWEKLAAMEQSGSLQTTALKGVAARHLAGLKD